MFGGVYRNKRVLVTGHTGFKGSWLCKWLNHLGAEVFGYSLNPSTEPNHFDLSNPKVNSHINNIQDFNSIRDFITKSEPEIIFHLAAQPLVIESYKEPLETFTTNVIGTANILEAARYVDTVKAVIIITTDKCYKNKECIHGYRETDELGGYDPYSASKACTELVTESYKNSFFKNFIAFSPLKVTLHPIGIPNRIPKSRLVDFDKVRTGLHPLNFSRTVSALANLSPASPTPILRTTLAILNSFIGFIL